MDLTKQRIAIAEARGYYSIIVSENGVLHGRKADMHGTCGIPDYLNNLNAIHEAIKSLNEWHHCLYVTQLKGMLGSIDAVDATASQRSEAFLKALGLWEDEK